ncbi:pre-rRNA processing and 40S ribosomal subunit assembly [Clonorchis sinensis]|uniref:FAS-associated factor 1 n=2 Tax=Clonorchis sinensis TaxID=79923 RepID=G7YD41_CLOSI|nr:pre-rRNA processing and 40S ribosomal subunit assembly [Clonorchis sinensis]GAA50875.1 FAS-associated factor 1 [Clonorchis sinensis]
MDRAAVLADFQALTRIEDIEYCISLLETHQWNLSDAVTAAFKDGTCDADIDVTALGSVSSPPEHPPSPVMSRPAVVDQPRVRWNSSEQRVSSPSADPSLTTLGTSSVPGTGSQTNPSGPPATDAATGPLFSSSSVRLLQFDIQLDLPSSAKEDEPQSVHERFTFPDTETVGSLKRHFVEAHLTELTLLATSPEWSSVFPEVTSKRLVSHLAFEGSGTQCFTDDSVTLRELHLPTSTVLFARLVRKPRSVSPQTTHPSPIELQVLVPYEDDSTGQSAIEFRSYSLRLLPNWRLNQLRQDVAGLTEIPVARQSWSVVPSTSPKPLPHSDSPLTRLVDALSCPNTNGFDKHSANPSLLELGLRPETPYKLYLTPRQRTVSSTNVVTSPKSSAVPTTTARQTIPKAFSGRKVTHPRPTDRTDDNEKQQSEMDDDSDDEGEDEEEMDTTCWSDDNAEQIRSDLPNPWISPLISESNCAGDPGEATEQFCAQFILRYCGDGETQVPPFITGSLDSALAASVNKPTVAGRKPLFLYLHHDASVACHLFCQRVLCSTGLVRFLGDNDFSVWPWDVTVPRAKDRLLGWLKSKLPGLVGVLSPLTVDSYPVLAMVGKLAGQLEVLCTVLGTGTVVGPQPKPVDESGFPSLDVSGVDTMVPISGVADGVLKSDTIVAALWQAYTSYSELLAPEHAAEEERLARQRVIKEQEQAYQESLRLDRMKVEAAEKERLEQQLLEEQRMHEKYEEEQRRLRMVATLPPEPPAPNSLAAAAFLASPKGTGGIASLRFRLPRDVPLDKIGSAKNGLITRRFAGLDQLKHVFAFMESQGFPRVQYKLLTTYPRRDLTALDENATMADLKLVPQETLTIEER